jgi:autotransporter-associated beta strand protein
LAGANLHGGITTVSGGTLIADNIHALGDSSGAVTVNAASTLDFNGKSQVAGKSYVLAGGSLLNNGGLAVTINNGASGNFTTNGSAQTASSGVWTSGTPTVAFSAPGGSGTTATGEVLLQLGWLRGNSDGATVGSGYLKEPRIIFSDPDGITIANGGRPIKATAFLTNTAGGTSVAGVTIIDPGYGYASVPTVTIDNTGTGGAGFNPVFTMTASGVRITNAGSGYTSAPTVTFGGAGYAGFATGQGGFGSISVNSTSNIGGSGDLVVDAVASGAGGLNKVGAGTVLLNNVNTYAGLTDVQAGTLGGTGSIAGNLQVGASGKIAPGASIESFGVGGNADLGAGTLLIEYDGSGVGSIDLLDVVGSLGIGGATVNFSQLGAAANDPAYVFASYGSLPVEPFASVLNLPSGYQINYHYNDGNDSNNIALVAVPEPTSAGALAAIGLLITARRRRRRVD